jgi:hypothetical protein
MTSDELDLAVLACRRIQAQRLRQQVLTVLARERGPRLDPSAMAQASQAMQPRGAAYNGGEAD